MSHEEQGSRIRALAAIHSETPTMHLAYRDKDGGLYQKWIVTLYVQGEVTSREDWRLVPSLSSREMGL